MLRDTLNPEKIITIYNPLDLTEINSKVREPLEHCEKIFNYPVIITSGRLTKQKAQWYLLRIFKELKRSYPELKLVILGDGELKNYLVTLSKELELKTFVGDKNTTSDTFDVYFLGFQKNPFKFIARSKLFVFPSLWEGFGNVLVEAMACGVPVVSSDCRSGPREILAPDTDFEYQTEKPEFAKYGVLMPVFKLKFKKANEPLDEIEKMWVEVISEFLQKENLRQEYAHKAKERATDFDIEKIIEEYRKVLKGLSKNEVVLSS